MLKQAELAGQLEQAFGSKPRSQAELLKRAWPVLTTPTADRVFALYFQVIGLASTGQAPYDALARALAALAQIDGLLLLRQIVGGEAAETAA